MKPYIAEAESLAIFRLFVEERTGINYGPAQSAIFLDKLTSHAHEEGHASLMDFYYALRYDDADGSKLAALVDALVVGETYFFREFDQLKMLVDEVLVPAVKQGRHPRVWSAACATGEEPLTLAMLLAERRIDGAVDVVASDISRRALRRAERGEFTQRSLRQIPDVGLSSRFIQVTPQGPRVQPAIAQTVTWHQVNLIDKDAVAALGSFDVILCRNVLIYFSDATICAVVDNLCGNLKPDGYLAVGASESLLRFGLGLACEEKRGVFVYKKVPK